VSAEQKSDCGCSDASALAKQQVIYTAVDQGLHWRGLYCYVRAAAAAAATRLVALPSCRRRLQRAAWLLHMRVLLLIRLTVVMTHCEIVPNRLQYFIVDT
jgi:hypothetical protein